MKHLCNEELAEQVGQDKPIKEAIEAYDSLVGNYKAKDHPQGTVTGVKSTVSPLGSIRHGK